jgi:hypothetical protein
VNGWTDGWTDGWVDEWISERNEGIVQPCITAREDGGKSISELRKDQRLEIRGGAFVWVSARIHGGSASRRCLDISADRRRRLPSQQLCTRAQDNEVISRAIGHSLNPASPLPRAANGSAAAHHFFRAPIIARCAGAALNTDLNDMHLQLMLIIFNSWG